MLQPGSHSQLLVTAAPAAYQQLMLCTYRNRHAHSLPYAETVQYTHRIINTTLPPTASHQV
jgi:hypothetical protein